MHFPKANVKLTTFFIGLASNNGRKKTIVLKCQPHGINDKMPTGFSGDRLSCNTLDRCTTTDGRELSLIPLGDLKCAY